MTEHTHETGGQDELVEPLRRGVPRPAGKVLLSILICLGVWLLLAAPRMEKAASASPDGARRTVALALLRPIAWLSENSGISKAVGAIEEAMGKDPDDQPGGELDLDELLEGEDLPALPPPEDRPVPPKEPRKPRPERPDGKRADDPLRKPTERYRLRIAVIGDSLADGIGDAIQRNTRSNLVHVLSVGRIATGLARADYFDWVEALAKIKKRYRPDVVVMMLGGNDKQSVVFPGGRAIVSGDPDWGPAYRERIADLLGEASGSHVVWVGLPPVRDRGKSRLFLDYNDMYEQAMEERRNSAYIDIWEMFANSEGEYRAYGKVAGRTVQLRAGDGAHFTITGYDLIADEVLTTLTKRWDLAKQALR